MTLELPVNVANRRRAPTRAPKRAGAPPLTDRPRADHATRYRQTLSVREEELAPRRFNRRAPMTATRSRTRRPIAQCRRLA